MRRTLVAGIVAVLAAGAAGRAADVESKIGCVDMERLLAAHSETKRSDEIIENQAKEIKAERETMLAKLKGMEKDYQAARDEADNRALSEAGREKKRQEADEKRLALQEYAEESQQTLALRQRQLVERRKRMRERIVDQIHGLVETHAGSKGLVLVLDSGLFLDSPGAVVYSVKKMDITEDILKLLAAQSAGKEEGESVKTDTAPAVPAADEKKP
jgi:Skp family chaperone for outer membrane proteins